MIKVKRADTFEDIGKKRWQEVLSLYKENHVFQTYEYASTWWRHFGQTCRDKKLLLLYVEEGGSIRAIAPLMATRSPYIRKPIIQFVGTDIADYMDFIIDQKDHERYFLKIMEYLSGLDFLEIDLKYIPPQSNILTNFSEFNKRNGIYGRINQVDVCPYIDLTKEWSDIIASLKNKFKKEISRQEKKLAEKGELVFRSFTSSLPEQKILEDYFRLHVKKWKYFSKRYSQFQYKHWRDFIMDLSCAMADEGWLDISLLEQNKNMLACHFGFRYNNSLHYYMPTFDPDFAAFSPAKILIMKMVEGAHKKGLAEFDFLRGNEPYKLAWTRLSRPIYNIFYYSKIAPLRYPGLIYRALRDSYTRNIKLILKKFRPLMKVWYNSRGDIT